MKYSNELFCNDIICALCTVQYLDGTGGVLSNTSYCYFLPVSLSNKGDINVSKVADAFTWTLKLSGCTSDTIVPLLDHLISLVHRFPGLVLEYPLSCTM